MPQPTSPQLQLQLQPTSLRRSPRLLQLKHSPKPPPNHISPDPFTLSSLTSPCNPRTRSRNPGTTSKVLKKSIIGSKIFAKSANGSKRTTKMSDMGGGFEGLRRSPRFRNKVNNFDEFVHCNDNNKSVRRSNKDNDVKRLDFVECPVTPVRVLEKRLVGVLGKDDDETSDSCEEIEVNYARRITRSCSRLVGRKVEGGKVGEGKENGRKLCKDDGNECRMRATRGSRKSLAVGLDGEMRGKENRRKSCIGIGSGSRTISDCVEKDGGSDDSCKKRDRRVTRGSWKSLAVRVDGEVRGEENIRHSCIGIRGGEQGRRNNVSDCVEKDGGSDDSCKERVENLDMRITRSASKQLGRGNGSQCRIMESRRRNASKCEVGKAKIIKGKKGKQRGSGSSKHHGTEPQKRVLRCSVSSGVVEREKKAKRDIGNKVEKESSDRDALPVCDSPARGETREQDFAGGTKLIGVKRKRKQIGLQGTHQGWTTEQEVALHKAYFTAKPSPHFWKKVAKLVPGKSAQECFDKVHSGNQTPVCTKPLLKSKKQNSPFESSSSGIDLFKSADKKGKKTCKKKCKSNVARKTVRQLLQKYCHVNQDNEADLFSVLEPSVNPSAEALQLNAVQLTPKHLVYSPESSSKSHDRSSSGHVKRLSRFCDRSESHLTSPPVLKKVKNMVLHERYIDQLHIRERKRKMAFSRCMKSIQNQKDGKENSVLMKDVIRAAKEALVSDAKDAINKFQYSQANIMDAFSDSEDLLNSDNDEDEAEL